MFKVDLKMPKNVVCLNDKFFETSLALKKASFDLKPESVGLLLKYKNKPTHRLLDYNKKRIKNYIILDEKSSFLFSCNRRVLKKGMVKKNGSGPYYLALNKKREVLGVIKYFNNTYNNMMNIGIYHKQDKLKGVVF